MENARMQLQDNGFTIPDQKDCNFNILKDLIRGKNSEFTGDRVNKIFVLIDGFGYNLIDKISNRLEVKDTLKSADTLREISTVFPSATMCVTSSLFSGLWPSEHGLIGDIMPVAGLGLVNVMHLSDALSGNKEQLSGLQAAMLFPKNENILWLKEREFVGIFPRGIKHYPAAKLWFEDLPAFECDGAEQIFAKAKEMATEGEGKNMIIYYGELDHIEHMTGHLSQASIGEAIRVIKLIGELKEVAKANGYNVIATADHGQLTVKDSEFVTFNKNSKVSRSLAMPPWGNARTMFLAAKEGEEDKLEQAFEDELGGRGLMFKVNDLISSEIFGGKDIPVSKRYNFGTHIVVEKGSYSVNFEHDRGVEPWFDRPLGQIGTHGGMSKDEMRVPLLIF